MQKQFLFFWTSLLTCFFLSEIGCSSLSSGCGKSLPAGFSSGQTTSLIINATDDQPTRQYNVHLSSNYNNNRSHAVVFSFHGHNGDMATQEDLSELSHKGLLINGAGIIAVYPQGTNGTDGGSSWQGAPYSHPNVDDVITICSFSFTNILLLLLLRL